MEVIKAVLCGCNTGKYVFNMLILKIYMKIMCPLSGFHFTTTRTTPPVHYGRLNYEPNKRKLFKSANNVYIFCLHFVHNLYSRFKVNVN